MLQIKGKIALIKKNDLKLCSLNDGMLWVEVHYHGIDFYKGTGISIGCFEPQNLFLFHNEREYSLL